MKQNTLYVHQIHVKNVINLSLKLKLLMYNFNSDSRIHVMILHLKAFIGLLYSRSGFPMI